MSSNQVVADNEFADVAGTLEGLGLERDVPPTVQRRWVSVIAGGHVSGVSWGAGPAEIVLLHDARRSARAWDRPALALNLPALALDLPGHGRSNWRRDGVYQPRKLAPAIAEAVRSFAPKTRVVVGRGLGALTAIALTVRNPGLVRGLVLIDTLPGTAADVPAAGPTRFASRDEALTWLRQTHPSAPPELLADDVRHEAAEEDDGTWGWRHHLGNLPPERNGGLDDETLWDQIGAVAAGGVPVLVVRPGSGSRLTAPSLDELSRRAPGAQVVTVTESAGIVEHDQPARLADLIREFHSDTPQGS
ncbi:alpha/beta fold hydrolase [Sphaerisporangium sp. NPDC004334]